MWNLDIAGRRIETSGEHPFYAWERGWVGCNELRAGDTVLCDDGKWRAVESVEATGRWAALYNFRVAEHHTYFVGKPEWGFSVWAHNAYAAPVNGTAGHAYPTSANTSEKRAEYRHIVGNSRYIEYGRKHLQAKSEAEAISFSRGGSAHAQYHPDFASDNKNNGIERTALMHGFIVDHGGAYHAYIQFDRVVGYDRGKPTRWIRAEVSKSNPFDRHGHPMAEDRLPQAVRDHFGV